MTLFWLQVTARGVPAGVVPVRGALVVGREGPGVVLDDPTVSRRHLELTPSGDVLVCRDLGSANGTFVDGVRIAAPVVLAPGARVRVGESELVVHEGRDTASGDTPPASATRSAAEPRRPSTAVRALGRAGRLPYRSGGA